MTSETCMDDDTNEDGLHADHLIEIDEHGHITIELSAHRIYFKSLAAAQNYCMNEGVGFQIADRRAEDEETAARDSLRRQEDMQQHQEIMTGKDAIAMLRELASLEKQAENTDMEADQYEERKKAIFVSVFKFLGYGPESDEEAKFMRQLAGKI